MDSTQLQDPVPANVAHENYEQLSARFELQHRLSSLQPPSPISQIEAQEARIQLRASHPETSLSSDVSSLHSKDENHSENREVLLPHDSSAQKVQMLHSDDGQNQRKSNVKRRSRTLRAISRAVNDWWLLETLSCLVALIFLAATITILSMYNNRALPHWPYSITVNSLISLFVTILKAALLLPIAKGISQLKWLWFRHSRCLNDFNTFDIASRGPWGACQLLFTLRSLHMASLGSLLTIAVLAIDPFTQQVVQYTTRNVPIPYMNASLPRRNNFNPSGNYFSNIGLTPIDISMKSAIYDTLYNPSGDLPAVKPNCPTGNCTFPLQNGTSFSTIGVCSRCAEITYEIKTVCFNLTIPHSSPKTFLECQHTLPNGQRLISPSNDTRPTVGFRHMVANSTLGSLNRSLALQDIGTAFSNFSMLSYVNRNCTSATEFIYNSEHHACLTPFAVECVLSFCVKSYTASVENNVLSEHVVSEFSNRSPFAIDGDHDAYVLAPQSCVVDGKSQDLASFFGEHPNNTAYLEVYDLRNATNTYVLRACVYSVLSSARQSITGYFDHFFDGTVVGFDLSSVDYSPEIMQTLYNSGNATLETLTDTFAKLATSMTNSMRQNGYDVETAQGLTYKNEVYIHVRWAWLTLPITLVLLSIVFLIITMIQSANVNIWKSSSLALLYHGLQDGQHHGAVDSIQQMEELARNHQVALRRSTSHGDLRLI